MCRSYNSYRGVLSLRFLEMTPQHRQQMEMGSQKKCLRYRAHMEEGRTKPFITLNNQRL
jgi:hypothetical protein